MTVPEDDNLEGLRDELEFYSKQVGFLPARFNDKFILDGHTPVECNDLILWAMWFEDTRKKRIVQQDRIGDFWVSTVFLGLNHNWWGDGPPILFETMVFDRSSHGKYARTGAQERYCTWDEALAGHLVLCAELRLTWFHAPLHEVRKRRNRKRYLRRYMRGALRGT
jgi:hypothetical protein